MTARSVWSIAAIVPRLPLAICSWRSLRVQRIRSPTASSRPLSSQSCSRPSLPSSLSSVRATVLSSPPSRAAERLQAIEAWLARPDVEVRRYLERFLHGKAYLFGSVDDPRAALVTSANLTGAGLEHNLELGLVDYNVAPSKAALTWFEQLWDQSVSFDDELSDLLFPAIGLVDPETV